MSPRPRSRTVDTATLDLFDERPGDDSPGDASLGGKPPGAVPPDTPMKCWPCCAAGPMPACCGAWMRRWPPSSPGRMRRPGPPCWWPPRCWRRWRGAATAACPWHRWPAIPTTCWPGPPRRCPRSRPCGRCCPRACPAGWRRWVPAPWCAWSVTRARMASRTLASPWCWPVPTVPRRCCTCAATGTTSAPWPPMSSSARRRRPWPASRWTKLRPGDGWTACSRLRRKAAPWTGRSWPARWRCAAGCR